MRSVFVTLILLLFSACTADANPYTYGYDRTWRPHPRYYNQIPHPNSQYYSRPVLRERTYCWTEYTWDGVPYRECRRVEGYSYEPWYRQPRAEIYLHWER